MNNLLKQYIRSVYFLMAVSLLVISSCKTGQKSGTEIRQLPEITIKPSQNTDEYRSSVKRQWDLIHTSLDVKPDWKKKYLYGTATISLRPHFYPTGILQLDARGMLIEDVRIISGNDSTEARFTYANDSLSISLSREYRSGDTLQLFIRYVARPEELKTEGGSNAISSDKGLYFINAEGKEPNKPRQIWTQGETQSNSVWFPTIDVPNQKMTQQISITVDSVFKTLSNGLLIKSIKHQDGTRTDTWKQDKPHAPYLAMMAIGPYTIVSDQWKGKDVNYYIEPEYRDVARKIFGNTPEMLEFFSAQLGVSYPWDKYSQVVVRDFVSGAMENTSATLHGEFLQRDSRELLDGNNEDVIAHELYHHWFGDLATCESWSNLPLNESFATYGEYLWNEHKYGREEADIGLYNDLQSYLRESKNKKVNLIRFQYENREDMFDRHSYAKGGTILHMLRKYTGDSAFFASLKLYLERQSFKAAEVHHLRLAFEDVTGEDMNWFFNQWFLDKGHPVLDISYEWNAESKKATVIIRQDQDLNESPLYKLPIDIDIYESAGKKRERVILSMKEQRFTFDCNEKPKFINVDAEKSITAVRNDHHSNEEWMTMYKTAPLFQDRLDALMAISKDYNADSKEAEIIMESMSDQNWRIRMYSIGKIAALVQSEKKESVRKLLMDIGQKDSKSDVREAAIDALGKYYTDEELIVYYSNAIYDSSYSVNESALFALAELNKDNALKIAKQMESDSHRRVSSILCGLYAKIGNDDNAAFMQKAIRRASGMSLYGQMQQYGRFLKRCKNTSNIQNGIEEIYNGSKKAEAWIVRLGGTQALSEVQKHCSEEMESAKKSGDTAAAQKWDALKQQSEKSIDDLKKNETNPMLLKIYNSGK